MQVNIVIGREPPKSHLKSYFINQSGIKYMVGDSAVFGQLARTREYLVITLFFALFLVIAGCYLCHVDVIYLCENYVSAKVSKG